MTQVGAEKNLKWCHIIGKHALDGMTYVRIQSADYPDGMCIKWPECSMCASGGGKGESARKARDLMEGSKS